jgi:hypothetical protein
MTVVRCDRISHGATVSTRTSPNGRMSEAAESVAEESFVW